MVFSGQTTLRVRFEETDKMGIGYHSNYLIWFEVGRTELFRNIGIPYTAFEEQGIGLVVVEANCRYKRPAQYDDSLTIETVLEELSSRKVTFVYRVLRDEVVLCEGNTVHLFVNQEGKPINARNYPIWQQVLDVL